MTAALKSASLSRCSGSTSGAKLSARFAARVGNATLPLCARSTSSSSAEIVEVKPGSPMVVQPATPSHGGSDDGEDEIDEEPDSGKRRADSDYPSGDESDSDDDAGYQD